MGRVFEGILMVTTIYIAYKIGKSDGKKEVMCSYQRYYEEKTEG